MQAMLVDQIFHPTNTSTIIPCLMVSRIRDPNPVQWRSPGNSISPFISPCFLFWREDSLHGKKSLNFGISTHWTCFLFRIFRRDVLELPSWVTSTKGWEVKNWVHGWPCSSTTVWAGHRTFWVQLLIQRSLHQIITKKYLPQFFLPIIIIIWFVIIFAPVICCIYTYRMHAVSIVCLVFTHLRRLHILAEATRLIVFQHTWSLISTRLADIQQTS